MALGESICQVFTRIKNNPAIDSVNIDLPDSSTIDCFFSFPVLSKITGGDNYTNDKSSYIGFYDNGINSVALNLQKYESGIWSQKAVLNDNTYGTFYPLAFDTNDFGERLIGYQIEWQKVLVAFGEGSYRIQTEETPIGNPVQNRYSFEWCLNEYTPERANETLRIDFYNKAIKGSPVDDKRVLDFANQNWFNQVRLPEAIFGNSESEYEEESVRYRNGALVWTKNEQSEFYRMITGYYPKYVHDFIKTSVFMADEINITTFYANGNGQFTDKRVKLVSEYSPQWFDESKNASVELRFEEYYKNKINKRC